MVDNLVGSEGYKNTDVGIIPKDWDSKTAAKICLKIQDGTHFSPTLGGSDYLYVTSKHIGYGILDITNADKIDSNQHRMIYDRCDVKKGDLLLTKDGASTGNAAINNIDEEISLLSSVAFLRFDHKKHSSEYYLQQVLSFPGQKRIKDVMVGNAITRLTLNKIRNLLFPVPSFPEQKVIAEVLSDMDALINSLDKLIEKKRNIKQGAMQELLTGKKRLQGFKDEWEVNVFGSLIEINKGQQLNKSELTVSGEYPAWNGGIEPSGYTNKWNMNENTITISEGGNSCGFVNYCRTRFWLGGHCYALKIKNSVLDALFLYQFLKFKEKSIMSLRIGSGLPNIQKKNLNEYKLLIPNEKAEQAAIVAILFTMDAEIDAMVQKRDKYRSMKQSMMQVLLTGKIRLIND